MTINVWSWRQGILKSKLQSTTKLVLLALSTYMNDHGNGCYPSMDTIASDTSLSRRAVFQHITNSIKEGWLERTKRDAAGRKWASNEYEARFPKGTFIASENAIPRDAPNAPLEPSRGAPDALEGCTTCTDGVHHVHINSPLNSPLNSSSLNSSAEAEAKKEEDEEDLLRESFKELVAAYPQKIAADNAFPEYCRLRKSFAVSHQDIVEKAKRYELKLTQEKQTKYAVYLKKWLETKGWRNDYPQLPEKMSDEQKLLAKAFNDATNVLISPYSSDERVRRLVKFIDQHGMDEISAMFGSKVDAFGYTRGARLKDWYDREKMKQKREETL